MFADRVPQIKTLRTRDEVGATATEYGILVGFLVFAIVAGATLFGESISQAFTDLAAVLDTFDLYL